jgi:hypothetical protein
MQRLQENRGIGQDKKDKGNNKLAEMKQEELKQMLTDMGYEGTVLFESPSYDTACVGITEDGRCVYDYEKMVQHLIEVDEMSYEEAEEFISYNTIRSLPYYDGAPVVVNFFDIYDSWCCWPQD